MSCSFVAVSNTIKGGLYTYFVTLLPSAISCFSLTLKHFVQSSAQATTDTPQATGWCVKKKLISIGFQLPS